MYINLLFIYIPGHGRKFWSLSAVLGGQETKCSFNFCATFASKLAPSGRLMVVMQAVTSLFSVSRIDSGQYVSCNDSYGR